MPANMSNPKKVYFLPPTWDYHPDGPIQLGSIIASPNAPADALNASERVALAQDAIFPPTNKAGVTWSTESLHAGHYGLWTKFLAPLSGLGIDVGAGHTSQQELKYAFDSVETTEFIPTPDYLERAMAAPGVRIFLESSRFRKHVYMITAVKIVRGAKAKAMRSRQLSGELKIALDGTMTGAPANLGPELSGKWKTKEGGSFDSASDFVFAFRLRKIVVHRSGRVTQSEHISGAMYEYGKPTSTPPDMPFSVVGLEPEDASPSDFGYDADHTADVVDEGEECLAVHSKNSLSGN